MLERELWGDRGLKSRGWEKPMLKKKLSGETKGCTRRRVRMSGKEKRKKELDFAENLNSPARATLGIRQLT